VTIFLSQNFSDYEYVPKYLIFRVNHYQSADITKHYDYLTYNNWMVMITVMIVKHCLFVEIKKYLLKIKMF
jgi:hypothetical protein